MRSQVVGGYPGIGTANLMIVILLKVVAWITAGPARLPCHTGCSIFLLKRQGSEEIGTLLDCVRRVAGRLVSQQGSVYRRLTVCKTPIRADRAGVGT